jgi:hypothetical protein
LLTLTIQDFCPAMSLRHFPVDDEVSGELTGMASQAVSMSHDFDAAMAVLPMATMIFPPCIIFVKVWV